MIDKYIPLLSDPLNLGALAALILLAFGTMLFHGRSSWLSHIQRKALLTANELEFFHRLQRALPAYQVFPQVSFAAVLTDDRKLSRNSRWSLRGRFDRKIADYVICECGSLKTVALVELTTSRTSHPPTGSAMHSPKRLAIRQSASNRYRIRVKQR